VVDPLGKFNPEIPTHPQTIIHKETDEAAIAPGQIRV
jgi:hypothetical protein